MQGAATIANGDYNLALAAVPSQQDTLVLAGANDLWKCSLAMGCVWRNTTNSTTCMSAQVGEFQHALAWNAANPLEIFVGNDSGLWRSTDAIGETGPACSASDATHFQNLNGSLGSLAEVESLSSVDALALHADGRPGSERHRRRKERRRNHGLAADSLRLRRPGGHRSHQQRTTGTSTTRPASQFICVRRPAPARRRISAPILVVTDADVGGDGDSHATAGAFLVDPLDTSQLLIGTCRVWRGPATGGSGWSAGQRHQSHPRQRRHRRCLQRRRAHPLHGRPASGPGSEVIYLGMYGSANNGANLPGHVLSAVFNPSTRAPCQRGPISR